MANYKRTMGVQKNIMSYWKFPFTYQEWWDAASEVYRLGSTAYCKISKLTLQGSTSPQIYIGVTTRKGVWAYVRLGSKGVFRMYWSIASDVLKCWKDKIAEYGYEWVRKAHLNLWAHESWHGLMNTWSEVGTWPLTPTLITQFQKYWGVGIAKLDSELFMSATEAMIAEKPSYKWYERIFSKREIEIPLSDTSWMEEK